MLGLDLAGGEPLVWQQRDTLGLNHELQSGDQVVATLKWNWRTGVATADAGGHVWTFQKRGVLHPEVRIGVDGQEDAAVFQRRVLTRSGGLELPGLGRLTFVPTGLISRDWEWTDANGALVRLVHASKVIQRIGRVEVAERARSLKELPLLLMLAWYVRMQTDMDQSAGS